ncbi:MAG: hypothetical protein QJR13_03265 [Bacillota bacterium]|nr:hypothetical protein [Bacillota bacterium]
MKRVLVMLLVAAVFVGQASPAWAGDSFADGLLDGQAAADTTYSAVGHGIGGFAGGFLFGLIGGGVAVGISAAMSPTPPPEVLATLEGKSGEYKQGFLQGYQQRAKSKQLVASATGAGLGVLCAVIVVSSANRSAASGQMAPAQALPLLAGSVSF